MAFVELEKKGAVGVITMNRPEALNALNVQVLRDLDAVLGQVEQDDEILVAVLTGAGSEEGTRALPVCAVGVGAWAAGAFA